VEAPKTLQIGDVSAQTGLSRDALRYYEKVGLIPHPRRTTGGFRVYPANVLDRIRFIKQAQIHGLTLREIRDLLGFQDRRGRDRCRQVQRLLTSKLADIEERLRQLQEFQHTLRGYLSQCERTLGQPTEEECPVVRSLSEHQS
jgi:DNA-binding transcriptional MerR regulator